MSETEADSAPIEAPAPAPSVTPATSPVLASTSAPIVEPPAPEGGVLLDDFARSNSGKGVELLHAFTVEERSAHRTKDTPSAFASRLAAFASRPA